MHVPQSVLYVLQGDIISDLCAGLIGGLGLTPSANVGARFAQRLVQPLRQLLDIGCDVEPLPKCCPPAARAAWHA